MKKISAYIMAGGVGSRLSPLSTPDCPKPFLRLIDKNKTMLQLTVERLSKICDPYVICNKEHVGLVAAQVGDTIAGILTEETPLNTAWTAYQAAQHCKTNNLCLLVPSDHAIDDTKAFYADISSAQTYSSYNTDYIYMFGVRPTYPSTDFGYLDMFSGEFHEKPSLENAVKYIDRGYLWNSGMFMFTPSNVIGLFNKHYPEFNVEPEPISFDKAIVERHEHNRCVIMSSPWSDVGTFQAIYDYWKNYRRRDTGKRTNFGLGSWTAHSATNNLILNYSSKVVADIKDRHNCVIIVNDKDEYILEGQINAEH